MLPNVHQLGGKKGQDRLKALIFRPAPSCLGLWGQGMARYLYALVPILECRQGVWRTFAKPHLVLLVAIKLFEMKARSSAPPGNSTEVAQRVVLGAKVLGVNSV